ncbi:MAG: calcium-binding protein [Roseobacter sp.]
MATPTEWLNQFQVNTGSAATGSQTDPQIVGLSNGNFLVAWQESTTGAIGGAPGSDIIAKVYNGRGGLIRDAFAINTFRSADNESDFDISPTNDGGFVIVYVDDDISNSAEHSIIYERYNANGVTRVDEGSAAFENGTGDLDNPQVAVDLTDNSFIITYEDVSAGNENISARVINSAGGLGAEFDAAQNSADFDRLGDTAVLTTGNFVTVYEEDDLGTTGIEFEISTPAGGTATFFVNVDNGTDPQVASLANGGFVVTYTFGGDVLARVFDNTGGAVGPNPINVAIGANDQNEAEVVALPDGDFVVVWDDDTLNQIRARRFDPDGSTDGSTFIVNDTVNVTNPNIGVTGDGRILFTYQNASFGNDNIFASIWDPRSNTINPNDYNVATENFVSSDIIFTRLTGGTVQAGVKGDSVFGQGGNDIIFSSGDGVFAGGGGNDTIHAGLTGALEFELLNGGIGTDTLITTSFNGNYTVNLVNGETDYAGNPTPGNESFLNFENITTGIGSDTIIGTATANVINTGAGNDTVNGGNGRDLVNLGSGNDTYSDTAQNDIFGRDIVNGGDGDDEINGGGGNDTLNGGNDDDFIVGGNGFDTINGGNGFDTINSGNGDDTVNGGNGRDITNLGDGNDTYTDTAQNDAFGSDVVNGGDGNDSINGGGGNDTLNGQNGNDAIFGGNGFDTINGGNGFDILNGGNGNDTVNGGDGRDVVDLGDGNDVYSDTAQNDINGRDIVNGGNGNDMIAGGGGNDTLNGQDGNDTIIGGNGFDIINGGLGFDTLNGNNGNDTMNGGLGDDAMNGGNNNDILNGNAGNDTLTGGNGNDIMNGGFGNDEFVFANGFGNDTIVGFEANNNLEDINLSAVGAIVNFVDLLNNHMSQSGSDVIIDTGAGDTISVVNVDIGDMNFADFIF